MAMTAEEVIDAARDFSPAFEDTKLTKKMLLRALTTAERELFGAVAVINELALARAVDVAPMDIRFALRTGNPLEGFPEFLALLDMQVYLTSDLYSSVSFVDERGSYAIPGQLVAEPLGGRLYFRPWQVTPGSQTAVESGLMEAATAVRIVIVPLPPTIVAMDQVLMAPDQARSALIHSMVSFMATRTNITQAKAWAKKAEETMAMAVEVIATAVPVRWRVLDTEGY